MSVTPLAQGFHPASPEALIPNIVGAHEIRAYRRAGASVRTKLLDTGAGAIHPRQYVVEASLQVGTTHFEHRDNYRRIRTTETQGLVRGARMAGALRRAKIMLTALDSREASDIGTARLAMLLAAGNRQQPLTLSVSLPPEHKGRPVPKYGHSSVDGAWEMFQQGAEQLRISNFQGQVLWLVRGNTPKETLGLAANSLEQEGLNDPSSELAKGFGVSPDTYAQIDELANQYQGGRDAQRLSRAVIDLASLSE